MDQNTVIRVEHVSKDFKLPYNKSTSIKSGLINTLRKSNGYKLHHTLKDINFTVNKGEFLGIVGKNGSGKSTLLKLLASIYTPSQGGVHVQGRLTPFIELGVGFNPELTARENVYLNGALLGFNRKEMAAMYQEIVDFAELQPFMDQKLKNYSSGMQVRLAFAIAIKASSDILLFDEVLAVGDTEFQKKCYDYFKSIKESGEKTVILVTHDMLAVQRFCDRTLVINDGHIVHDGDPGEAAVLYQNLNFPNESEGLDAHQKVSLRILDKADDSNVFRSGEEAHIQLTWSEELEGVQHAGIALIANDGSYIFGANTIDDRVALDTRKRTIDYHVTLNLGAGTYSFKAAVFGKTAADTIFFNDKGITIQVTNKEEWGGLTKLDHKWINRGKK
jgi:ABC-2 type transport system ATP-binding protein